jgi:hypothetical protein
LKPELESFVARVPHFSSLSPARQLEYFAYFLTEIRREDGISSARIEECFDILRLSKYSNIYAYIANHSRKSKISPPIFVRIKGKYYLHREHSAKLASNLKGSHLVVAVKSALRDLLPRIKDPNQKTFLAEALACFEVKAYRATIIMVWILPWTTFFNTFSHIASLRLTKSWLQIPISESRFLRSAHETIFLKSPRANSANFVGAPRIISNDVRKILDIKLGIRNTCAHPSGVAISEPKTIDAIDDLVNNVILKYPI